MNPLSILIAEDEAVIAMLLAEVLTGLGHNICASVATADEAVAAAFDQQPDLIIIDAGLRDSSGLDAIAAISASTPIPHIFITGNKAAVLARLPRARVIEKPFDEVALIAAINIAVPN
jgi:two-component system, response regulator PdtaR